MANKSDLINGKCYVYYDEKTRIAKRWLEDDKNREEAQEKFDEAKDDKMGAKLRIDGSAYRLIYLHSNDGYRNYVLVDIGRD